MEAPSIEKYETEFAKSRMRRNVMEYEACMLAVEVAQEMLNGAVEKINDLAPKINADAERLKEIDPEFPKGFTPFSPFPTPRKEGVK